MPINSAKTARDRAEGQNVGTHPRPNGDIILLPDDILEGQGYFTTVDEDGNPEGFRIGNVEQRDGWHVYEGSHPEKTTCQTTASLPADRPSFLFSQPSVVGRSPVSRQMSAKVAPPLAPLVQKVKAERVGYPASTEERPYWYAYSLCVRLPNGDFLHTMLSPFVKCEPNANGQGLRVPLPPPELAAYCGIWVTEPGSSTMDRAGRARLQRVVNTFSFVSGYYDLTGPYRYDPKSVPGQNETNLTAAGRASYRWFRTNTASRVGIFRFGASFASSFGEGVIGPMSSPLTIVADSYYGDENPAGYGKFRVYRPSVPSKNASGWYAWAEIGGNYYKIYDKTTGLGLTKPLPLSWSYIESAGWEGSEHWAMNDTILLASGDPLSREEDASGLAPPEEAPEAPTSFGAELPEPGRRFIRVTDTYRGKESLPSPAVSVDLAAGEVARVVYTSPVNAIPNASYVETDPNDLPFDHEINAPAGAARVIAGEMSIEVLPGQEGAVYQERTAAVAVKASEAFSIGSEFVVELPKAGQLSGVAQVVIEEENEFGQVISETVLYETREPGEHEFYIEREEGGVARVSGSVGVRAFVGFNPASFAARLVHRIRNDVNQTLKNLGIKVKRKQIKKHAQKPRPTRPNPTRPPGRPVVRPTPETPLPTDGEVVVSKPPNLPVGPSPPVGELRPVLEPDRPRSAGKIIEDLAGFLNGIPTGWTIDRIPTETTIVSVNAAAAISGSLGLFLRDTDTSSVARARISKRVAPEGRHDLGSYSKNRFRTMPVSSVVRMHPLTATNGSIVAYIEAGADREVATLDILSSPRVAGSVYVFLDGARYAVNASAVREVARLDITRGPTSSGEVSVTLDVLPVSIATGGEEHVVSLTVQTPRYNGLVRVTLDNVPFGIQVHRSDSSKDVAAKIRKTSYPGWKISGKGNQVIFTARTPGPKGVCTYDRSTSATPGSMQVLTAGAVEGASELADRIRATKFPGWRTSGTGAQVVFTAVAAGGRRDAEFSPGQTGVLGTMTTTTQGSADTPEALAARIRAGSYAGFTASGSESRVIFTATTQGFRRDLYFHSGDTQVTSSYETTVQGRSGDVFAVVRDSRGIESRRKIITELAEMQVFEADIAVSGAGTDEAIVSVWASLGNAEGVLPTRQLVARFEDVDLTGLLMSEPTFGVMGESSAQTTWQLHVDDAKVTDRGLIYHRDHDLYGRTINQVHGYFVPGQPVRDDLLLQGEDGSGKRIAVLPNRTYMFGAFVRHRGVKAQAKPLHLSAVLSDGAVEPLGCVTGGVAGTGGWAEYTRRVDVPTGCHELLLRSADIGAGEIVIQEVVPSLGLAVLRTDRYAASGSHTATLRRGTKEKPSNLYTGRKRRELAVDVESVIGGTSSVVYRSREEGAAPSGWGADSETPDREIVDAHVTLTGDGRSSPILKSGFPSLEYDVVLGSLPLATLLREDRAELPGGATFAELGEWSSRTRVGVRELPSGELRRQTLFDPVARIPGSVVQVFTPQAKRYIEERWGYELFAIEARDFGEVVWIRMAGQPEFEQVGSEYTVHGERYGLWQATIPPCEVTERRPLI